jgi:hypothetical protein
MAGWTGDLSQYIVMPTLYGNTTGVTTDGAGSSVDLIDDVANIVTAVLVVGTRTGTNPTVNFKMQESTDGTTWTDVSGGAFTQVTTSDQVQALAFKPTKRYVRETATVGGTNPVFPSTVTVLAPRRNVPDAIGGFNTTVAAG